MTRQEFEDMPKRNGYVKYRNRLYEYEHKTGYSFFVNEKICNKGYNSSIQFWLRNVLVPTKEEIELADLGKLKF